MLLYLSRGTETSLYTSDVGVLLLLLDAVCRARNVVFDVFSRRAALLLPGREDVFTSTF